MQINEIFGPTIQGEGMHAGVPSVFVRLNGCNLRCAFAGGSLCDTPYTSHCPEKSDHRRTDDVADTVAKLVNAIGGKTGHNSHIVITGGEPMLQQSAIAEVIDELQRMDYWNPITIETNGTIVPSRELLSVIDLTWSVSPKLSTSCCFDGTDVSDELRERHRANRINLDALSHIMMSNQDYQLKFVYSGPESVAEIKQLIADLGIYMFKECPGGAFEGIVEHKIAEIEEHIMLMPEGTTNEQLTKTAPGAVQACIENGWRFCDRTHIRIWGDKRAV